MTEEESTESEAESWGRDEDDKNNDHDSRSEGSDQERDSGDDNTQSDSKNGSDSEHETDENESGSESDQEEIKEDDETDEEEKNDEFVKTPSNDTDDEDETKINDKAEGDEKEGMNYTTNQFDDDVDLRMNEPVTTDEGFIHKEGTDAEMTNKTEVPVTSSSHSSDLASKFLNFSDISHTDAEIVSPMDVHVHHEVPSNQTPTLLTIPISVITESSPIFTTVISQSLPSFTPPPMVTKSLEHAVLAKESSQPKSTYEAAYLLIEFKLKKILIEKMDESQSYMTAPEHKECYDGLIKSYDLDKSLFSTYDKVYSLKKSRKDKDKDEDPSAGSYRKLKKRKTSKDAEPTKEELEFEVADFDMPRDQKKNLGNDDEEPKGKAAWPSFKLLKGTRSNYAELEYDFEECYKALLEKLDWNNPKGGDYPFDLTKPLPLVMNRNRQIVPIDYFFNNDLKYLQGGISTMTYMTSITKTKAAQYDLPGIEDMVPNIWSPVKVVNDKHALWGISHWRDQRKTFYGYARGLESSHDVYSTKCILAVTWVVVMRKHGYGYLKEIEVRRADNDLYKFMEGDFPRLSIKDIKDMLLLIVQNRLTNLSGNDVSDFAIALRMFTRSMVIQKRVEDLQLGVESYQKKINVTKPETTKPSIRKRDPYTPYQYPQGFIYVDNKGRNRLM
ncbi:hypothetical protein Tco_0933790 [Tanacetum coccineum]